MFVAVILDSEDESAHAKYLDLMYHGRRIEFDTIALLFLPLKCRKQIFQSCSLQKICATCANSKAGSRCYSSPAGCSDELAEARLIPLDTSTSDIASSNESLSCEQVATCVWPSRWTGTRLQQRSARKKRGEYSRSEGYLADANLQS